MDTHGKALKTFNLLDRYSVVSDSYSLPAFAGYPEIRNVLDFADDCIAC